MTQDPTDLCAECNRHYQEEVRSLEANVDPPIGAGSYEVCLKHAKQKCSIHGKKPEERKKTVARQVRLSIPSLEFAVDFYLNDFNKATPELVAHALATGKYKLTEIIRTEEAIEVGN